MLVYLLYIILFWAAVSDIYEYDIYVSDTFKQRPQWASHQIRVSVIMWLALVVLVAVSNLYTIATHEFKS